MTIQTPQGIVRLTCGGHPLVGPYLPPASDLAQLGRYLARKYGAKDADVRKEAPE